MFGFSIRLGVCIFNRFFDRRFLNQANYFMKKCSVISLFIGIVALRAVSATAQSYTPLPFGYYIELENKDFTTPFVVTKMNEDKGGQAAILPEGYYSLNREKEIIRFHINKQGMIDGEAIITPGKEYGEQNFEVRLFFSNALLQSLVVKENNKLIADGKVEGSIFTRHEYYENGTVKATNVEDNSKEPGRNTIYTEYYVSGKVKQIANSMTGVVQYYYPGGKLESERDHVNETYSSFFEDGRIKSKQYNDGNKCQCEEQYDEEGMISFKTKNCKNGSTEYRFENGKMIKYEVYDKDKGTHTMYDADGKELKGEHIPRAMAPSYPVLPPPPGE